MSKEDASRIEQLFRAIDEVRGVSFKALELAREKDAKLFGGDGVGAPKSTEESMRGGIIGEAEVFSKLTYTNIAEVCDFLAKL